MPESAERFQLPKKELLRPLFGGLSAFSTFVFLGLEQVVDPFPIDNPINGWPNSPLDL